MKSLMKLGARSGLEFKNPESQNKMHILLRKSQLSVEFIIILSGVFILLISMLVIVQSRNDAIIPSTTKYYARTLCDQLASGINSVYVGGKGTSRTVSLPDTLRDNTRYTLNIYPDSHLVEASWQYMGQSMFYRSPIISSRTSGNLTGIHNSIRLTNNNGVVLIENLD